MTEQQIENLKQLLSNSETSDCSSVLDSKILNAAKLQSEQSTNSAQDKSSSWFFHAFNSFGKLSAAALSVVITAALFVGLNQLISVDSSPHETDRPLVKTGNDNIEIELEVVVNDSPTNENIAEPKSVTPPARQPARDQILSEMELPNTADIMASLNFDIQQDRNLAEAAINIAMNDIRQFIGVGQLHKARLRYAELRKMCSNCTLPDTLEMLVFNANKISGNNPILNSS